METVKTSADFSDREKLKQVDDYLKEWGRWSSDNPGAGLGYPNTVSFMRVRGKDVEEYAMWKVEAVENAYTTWKMVVQSSPPSRQRTHIGMLLFILKIHYCEVGNVQDRVYHTGRYFRRPLSRSQYYVLLKEARVKFATLLF